MKAYPAPGRIPKALPTLLILLLFLSRANAQVHPDLSLQFQQIIESNLQNPGVKGISACVILPDGSQWTGKAGGNGSGTALTDSTVFYAGSTTKTLVSACILKLREEGLLHLDSPYVAYIDPIAFAPSEISLRQLLNHSSGLYSFDTHPDFFTSIIADPTYHYTASEALALFLDQPPAFSPGSQYSYSNTNYLILGMVIEAVTGQSLATVIRSMLFDPLAMDHSWLGSTENFPGPHAGLWMYSGSNLADFSSLPHTALLSLVGAAGSLVSIPSDLAWFIRKLISGEILQASSLQEMQTIAIASSYYGLGLVGIEAVPGAMIWGHNGAIGNLTDMFHSPELNLSVVVMQNSENGTTQPFNSLFLAAMESLNRVEIPFAMAPFTAGPNPFQDYIRISSTDPSEAFTFTLLSADGRKILEGRGGPETAEINSKAIPSGVYFMHIQSRNSSFIQKLIR